MTLPLPATDERTAVTVVVATLLETVVERHEERVMLAGTANLDARSLGINYELMVHLHEHQLAEEARGSFSADLLHSREISLREWRQTQNWSTRLRGAWARAGPS